MGRSRVCIAEEHSIEATQRPRRRLAIDSFSRAQGTGVWYYRVDVAVCNEELPPSTFMEEGDDDDSDDSRRSSEAASLPDVSGTEHYSILRRYNEFLQLYEQIRIVVAASEGDARGVPPFPVKEFISPTLVGLLWRVTSSKAVLEERRAKFEALLQWIASHPTAWNCPAFVDFLGKPPQTKDGYVSLKEYASPDWMVSLQQVTQSVEGRKRRYSAGSSAIRSLLERSSSENSALFGRQRLQAVREASTTRVLGKRRNRSAQRNRRLEPPRKKVALPAASARATDTDSLPNTGRVPPAPQSRSKRKVAQVEGNSSKKQCVA